MSPEKEYRHGPNEGRIKINERRKNNVYLINRKRRKSTIKAMEEKYKEVLSGEGKIKYCKLEKCKIVTEPGSKIIKRGQIVPQALIKRQHYI